MEQSDDPYSSLSVTDSGLQDRSAAAAFRTIWTSPRKAIRRILATDPESHVTVLIVLSGISESLARMSNKNAGDKMTMVGILAVAFLFAPLGALFGVWIYTHLTRISGRWLGGQAGYAEIKPAIAWASAPNATGVLLWIPLLFFVGKEMFTSATPNLDAHRGLALVILVFLLAFLTLNVWALVLLCNTVAEVQGYRSAWKGLANIFLAGAIVVIPLALISLPFVSAVREAREAHGPLLGKKVMTNKWEVEVQDDGKLIRKLPIAHVMTVTREDGDRLWFNDVVGGWVNRSDVVEYDQAIDYFTKRIEREPTSTNYRDRASARDSRGELDLAISDLNTAITLNPSDDTAFNARGLAWDDKGEHEKAIADFDEAIRLDPKFVQAFHNRACAWRNKGVYEKALVDLTEAIRLNGGYAEVFNTRGHVWHLKGEFDKAIDDYGEAIRLDPSFAVAYYNRADSWEAKGDFDKAIADYDTAIRLDPKDAGFYSNRGTLWYQEEEFEKAIADYDKAILYDPEFAIAYHNRGSSWYHLEEYEKAIPDYNQAIKLDPKFFMAYHNRGRAYEDLGNVEMAIADYREALKLEPNDGDDHEHLAWLLATYSEAQYRNGPLAVEHATAACKLSNWEDANKLDTLAAAYAENGDFAKAVETQEKALAKSGEDEKEGYQVRLEIYQSGKPYHSED